MRKLSYTFLALLAVVPAFAQKYEFGVAGGGSFYQSKTVSNPKGDVDGGFSNGWLASAYVGQNMYTHLSGEIRYTYLHNDLKLSGGGQKATFGGEAHAIHYDLLFHTTPNGSKIRPYVAAGGGVKFYRGTGSEVVFQPLQTNALLTKTSQTVGLVSVGAGVKVAVTRRMSLRFDVHDYLTPFPDKVIQPNVNSKVSGWINNIIASGGVSFVY
jgi:hypothetical protein